ncbi:MAG: hypothetical protein E6H07_12160 [Bacteroidetes bacterium]|nr:MAG: hypothetical protein E6H07_12160 [Bacteroidota bacterium]
MARLFILLVTVICFEFSNAQLKPFPGAPKPLTEKQEELEEKNRSCVHRDKFSQQQRLKLYPFNKAAQVQIVSFDKPDTLIEGKLPMKNKKVDYSQLKEIKTLEKAEIDSLTDILYNNGYRGEFHMEMESLCYNPRNAILFADSTGKAFAFIELCFECQGYKTSSSAVKTGDFCDQKYKLIQTFFSKHGIEFGTKENADE